MKYTKEERIEIGRKIDQAGMSNLDAAHEFGIAEESARRYRIMYEESIGMKHVTDKSHKGYKSLNTSLQESYEAMSKDELIQELMKSKINEARLKKGYMVKGDGANKEYFLSDNKNIK